MYLIIPDMRGFKHHLGKNYLTLLFHCKFKCHKVNCVLWQNKKFIGRTHNQHKTINLNVKTPHQFFFFFSYPTYTE